MLIEEFNKHIEKIDEQYLFEGIDIDYTNKKVNVNLNHEDGINTGLIINPSYSNINGYDVISIFKRKVYQNNRK